MLDILVAIPIGFSFVLPDAPRQVAVVRLSPVVAVSAATLLVHAAVTLTVAIVNGMRLPRWWGRVTLVTYVTYMLVVIALVLG